jgi:hypothetical protein
MRRLAPIVALVLCAALAPAAPAAPADDPLALITAIYRTYRDGNDHPGLPGVYSRRLQGLLDADEKNTPQGEVGKLDGDVFVDGQDWSLSNLRIALVSRSAAKAQVRAKFENFKQPRDIVFDLVREDGRWAIDEVASLRAGNRWSMSKILSGAPDPLPDRKK